MSGSGWRSRAPWRPTPRLLLLDEPLAGVDVAARAQIRDLLRTILAGFDGVAVLVVHDPVDALTLADRVTVLEDGRQIRRPAPPRRSGRHRGRPTPRTWWA